MKGKVFFGAIYIQKKLFKVTVKLVSRIKVAKVTFPLKMAITLSIDLLIIKRNIIS